MVGHSSTFQGVPREDILARYFSSCDLPPNQELIPRRYLTLLRERLSLQKALRQDPCGRTPAQLKNRLKKLTGRLARYEQQVHLIEYCFKVEGLSGQYEKDVVNLVLNTPKSELDQSLFLKISELNNEKLQFLLAHAIQTPSIRSKAFAHLALNRLDIDLVQSIADEDLRKDTTNAIFMRMLQELSCEEMCKTLGKVINYYDREQGFCSYRAEIKKSLRIHLEKASTPTFSVDPTAIWAADSSILSTCDHLFFQHAAAKSTTTWFSTRILTMYNYYMKKSSLSLEEISDFEAEIRAMKIGYTGSSFVDDGEIIRILSEPDENIRDQNLLQLICKKMDYFNQFEDSLILARVIKTDEIQQIALKKIAVLGVYSDFTEKDYAADSFAIVTELIKKKAEQKRTVEKIIDVMIANVTGPSICERLSEILDSELREHALGYFERTFSTLLEKERIRYLNPLSLNSSDGRAAHS